MSSFNIKRMTILPALALASVALALPLASQAAGTTGAEAPAAPHVGTGGAHASGTSTVLQGTINPHNLATTYYFQYGPTATYGSQTAPASLPAGATVPLTGASTNRALAFATSFAPQVQFSGVWRSGIYACRRRISSVTR